MNPCEWAVAIGASAGALDALSAILPALPSDFQPAVFIVVHLPANRENRLAELLQARTKLRVVEAEDKLPIQPGTIYLAPPDYHLLIEMEKTIALSADDPVNYSRPSIDVLFESAADVFKDRLTGVVLTGANQDGAQGLKAIAQLGGQTIVQDPQFAAAPHMPQAALAACPFASKLSLQDIAKTLCVVTCV